MTSTRWPIGVLLLGSLTVVLCYYFVDRPVAWYFEIHPLVAPNFLIWPKLISDGVTYLAVAGMVAIVVWRLWRPGGNLQKILLATVVALTLTTVIKIGLKWLFGRTWPRTWIEQNQSLISHNVYGFHPFHYGTAYQSFPSGHSAVTFAIIVILWQVWPGGRGLYLFIGGLMCGALVGLNYHFVGDVVAGAMLGSIVGHYTARAFRLKSA